MAAVSFFGLLTFSFCFIVFYVCLQTFDFLFIGFFFVLQTFGFLFIGFYVFLHAFAFCFAVQFFIFYFASRSLTMACICPYWASIDCNSLYCACVRTSVCVGY